MLVGDLKLDWLSSNSDSLKFLWFHKPYTINRQPYVPNIMYPFRSTLIDLILTNASHRYTKIGIFANGLSKHSAIATVRITKLLKTKPCILVKRHLKHFNTQAFTHDLTYFEWSAECHLLIMWRLIILRLINKHAPFWKFRVKRRKMPWFSPEISSFLKRILLGPKLGKVNPRLIGSGFIGCEINVSLSLSKQYLIIIILKQPK